MNINSYDVEVVKEMLSNIPGGVIKYENNKDKKITFVTDNMLTILECSREQFQDKYKNCILNVIVDEYINKFDMFVSGTQNHEQFEVKVNTYNGIKKWVSVNINKIINVDGTIDIYCVFMDVDKYKVTAENYELENEMFKDILNGNADIMFEYDIKRDVMSFNNVRNDIGKDEEKERKILDFIDVVLTGNSVHPDDKSKVISILSMDKTAEIEFRFVSMDGSSVWCSIRAISIKNKKGQNKKIIGWINNIDEQKKHEEYINELKQKDPLTKLYNQKAAKKLVDSYLANESEDTVNAMVIIDIDNFELINQKVGEVFGDAILINIASNIKTELRNDDIIARVGGDKYLVFLKDVENEEQVQACVKRLQNIIASTAIGDIKEIHISSSIGVTMHPDNGCSFDELFTNTDIALYYAKVYGKNRFEMYESDTMKGNGSEELFNSYEEVLVNTEYENFEQEVTAQFLEIMSKSRDLKDGIEQAIEMIGKKFKASNVNIIEVRNKKFEIVYNWSLTGIKHEKDTLKIRADEVFIDKYKEYIDGNNQLVVNNVNNLDDNYPAKWLIDKFNIRSFIQSLMKDNEQEHAVITISDTKCTHTWSDSQCRALKTLSLLLSSYLVKIRDSEMMEDRIKEVTNNDVLTGLPTIFNFRMEAKRIIKKDKEKKYAIANIDFKKFKYINDNYGYKCGDAILKEFADLINKQEYGIVTCCRYFSDNFLLLQEYESEEMTELYLNKLEEVFDNKVRSIDARIKLGLSIGVCVIENNYGDIMGPIDNSNIARRYAKELNTTVHFFDNEMKQRLRMEFEITNSMEMALAHNEFKVYYQTKVNISDGSIAGAEALVRWVKPDKTVMGPDSFIPLFEKNGFVVNLDYFVYEDVCKMIRHWIDNGMKVIPISVNVSRVHLYEEQSFIKNVIAIVDKYKIPHELIELELTENIFIDSAESALLTMKALKNEGFKVSIDDFGSGYSSLNLLKDMNSDVLKLDRAFFGKEELRKEEQIIVSSIVDMAKKLDIKVVSEGVETQQQSDFLKEIQCDLAQGFLFSRPIPREELEQLLNKEND